ncbi:hypothetical protein EDD95_5241 [Streptomyces sp. CEV 2-1]|uniref:hypothetical protein n=1 Tax=unclassified Streptomyces TaxID=2593676 RepID=UPI000FB8D6E9|nr:hypothetical protein [Streptomyces sp. CEV 2-1]ROQ72647.1 hypothetical protein EDD95_5241 [Streptomyces sp. CEV 2-1]
MLADHDQSQRHFLYRNYSHPYTLRIPAAPSVHRQLLDRCQPLDAPSAIPAQRKARREYANRVNALGTETP